MNSQCYGRADAWACVAPAISIDRRRVLIGEQVTFPLLRCKCPILLLIDINLHGDEGERFLTTASVGIGPAAPRSGGETAATLTRLVY